MAPWLGGILAYSAIASLGLPGLAGFWGEFLSLLGAYNPARVLAGHTMLYRFLLAFGVVGTLLTAGYFLWLLQRVNLGRPKEEWEGHTFKDILAEEWIAWAPLLILIIAVGVYPSILLRITTPAVHAVARLFGG
jgi:NADH-quinone oxidoreductase subunit M